MLHESREDSAHDVTDLENLNGSVFDQLIELYDHFKKELLNNVIRYIFTDVRARCRGYCHDRYL